jgi:arsenate reductase-like glutaredoxin family protein
MSCQRAQGFLESVGGTVTAIQSAKKDRIDPAEALKLARKMAKVVAARGKKVITFDMKADPPDDQTLIDHLIGPSGNLRAPAAIVGETLVVGFNDDVYRRVLAIKST